MPGTALSTEGTQGGPDTGLTPQHAHVVEPLPFLLQVLPLITGGSWVADSTEVTFSTLGFSVRTASAGSLDGGARTSTGHLRAERAINSYPFLLSTFLPPIYCVPGTFTWRSPCLGFLDLSQPVTCAPASRSPRGEGLGGIRLGIKQILSHKGSI